MIRSDWETLESLLSKLTAGETRELIERLERSLRAGNLAADPSGQSRAWGDLLRELNALPTEGPSDRFSGADHDRLLYGRPA